MQLITFFIPVIKFDLLYHKNVMTARFYAYQDGAKDAG